MCNNRVANSPALIRENAGSILHHGDSKRLTHGGTTADGHRNSTAHGSLKGNLEINLIGRNVNQRRIHSVHRNLHLFHGPRQRKSRSGTRNRRQSTTEQARQRTSSHAANETRGIHDTARANTGVSRKGRFEFLIIKCLGRTRIKNNRGAVRSGHKYVPDEVGAIDSILANVAPLKTNRAETLPAAKLARRDDSGNFVR